MIALLPFEKSLETYNRQLEKLRTNPKANNNEAINNILIKYNKKLQDIYSKLTPWDKVQIARHEERPHFQNYLDDIIDHFIPLAGDRTFGNDQALIGGIGFIDSHPVFIIGLEKGGNVTSRIKHNFGMAHPEGYRKATRLVQLASKFSVPIVAMIDTPGAYPGVEAEMRGQAEAIAKSIQTFLNSNSPILSIILGEGASGGAIALAASDRIAMLSYATYSVISPEGAASILFKDAKYAEKAATQMHLTADDMINFHIIDDIIQEPLGGAHRNPKIMFDHVKSYILNFLKDFNTSDASLKTQRMQKFLHMKAPSLQLSSSKPS